MDAKNIERMRNENPRTIERDQKIAALEWVKAHVSTDVETYAPPVPLTGDELGQRMLKDFCKATVLGAICQASLELWLRHIEPMLPTEYRCNLSRWVTNILRDYDVRHGVTPESRAAIDAMVEWYDAYRATIEANMTGKYLEGNRAASPALIVLERRWREHWSPSQSLDAKVEQQGNIDIKFEVV